MHTHALRLIGLAAITVLLLLTGCGGGGDDGGGAPLPTVTTRQQGAFLLTLSTSRTTYAPGETVPFTLTVTNTSAEAVTLYYITRPVTYAVDRNDRQVAYAFYRAGGYFFLSDTFAPGQSRSYPMDWQQFANVGEDGQPVLESPVPPGEYALNAWLESSPDGYPSPESLPDRDGIASAPLTIRIRD